LNQILSGKTGAVQKSGTTQSKPTSSSRLCTNPVVWRNGMPNRTGAPPRAWVAKFGSQYAKMIRRNRPAAADKWHLDEVVIPINGKKYWLWRAVDSRGDVLDILVQSRRSKEAASRFFRKLFIAATRVLTIDPKDRTDQPEGEKNAWADSNHQNKHSNFFLLTIRSKPSSARAAIHIQPLPIARPEPTPTGFGTTSRVSCRLPEIRKLRFHYR